MEGAEVDRERGEHPGPRWRALLDRARGGSRAEDPTPDPGDDLSWLDEHADAHRPDAHRPDAHRPDAHRPDAHRPDAHRPDAHRPDAHRPDAHRPDVHRVDGHRSDAPRADVRRVEQPADPRRPVPPARPERPRYPDRPPAGRPATYGTGEPPAPGPPPAGHRPPEPGRDLPHQRPPGAAGGWPDERATQVIPAVPRHPGPPPGRGPHPDPPPDPRHHPDRPGAVPEEPTVRLSPPAPARPRAEPRPDRHGDPRREPPRGPAGEPPAQWGAGPLAEYGGEFSFRATTPAAPDDPAVLLRRDFGGPRVVAFANPKGGVHKTTATVLAAATIGAARGRGVVAWDDNELRGTLGLRAGSARHARTVRHLVAALGTIERAPDAALRAELDDYLRHAPDASYDILAGEENPRFAQQLDAVTVQRVLDLLRRTHDVVCVDTGNNVQSANWQTVLRGCDQLVVTTVAREDAAFAADWMLDVLHESGLGALADRAVTLISGTTPQRSPLADDLERHFASRTRAVVTVPYDPALEAGSSIDHHALQPATRRAWLRAAAGIMAPFGR
ncbi:hypothetical protein GCM10010123_14230 [Pilimelia anulata]|uniref:MinD-like ATPase involved in chromosome partitioning or flagellar assembly n=1 Tax=Pilimelia anulata TaxID=53371 RepID=A0A8J3B101_9ACTN|nr:ATPase [Pilimelia anulata]GGJ85735.1 hypothetical protein GCM10010123_14230 [Pilimelia anulata]